MRLKEVWQGEYDVWSKRSLVGKEYVYVWADGIHSNVRLEDDKVCLLVLIGVTKEGQKELLAVESGFRESKDSWLEVLRDLMVMSVRTLGSDRCSTLAPFSTLIRPSRWPPF